MCVIPVAKLLTPSSSMSLSLGPGVLVQLTWASHWLEKTHTQHQYCYNVTSAYALDGSDNDSRGRPRKCPGVRASRPQLINVFYSNS